MKRPFPFLITGLIVTTVFMNVAGLCGRRSVYAEMPYAYEEMPPLSLSLEGIREGISPHLAFRAPLSEEPVTREATSLSDYPNLLEGTDTVSVSAPGESEGEREALTTQKEPLRITEKVDTPEEDTPALTQDSGQDTTPQASVTGTPADDAYYADALFIGDSRTVGLSQYCPGLDAYASFYCQVSLTIYSTLDAEIAKTNEGLLRVEDALSTERFGKIYLMIGINEIGGDIDDFIARYAAVVARIRELQPQAVIYLQSIMHVSSAKEAAAPVFSNRYINERNARIAALANGEDILYVDINYLIDDENGALRADLTFDGVHLTAGAYDLWYQAIRAQTK